MYTASAPGKLILCGEHAVVYGQPAIALPLADVRASASISAAAAGSGMAIEAPDLGAAWMVSTLRDDPLSEVALATLRYLNVPSADLTITLQSAIPIAGGLGSGAAIATALVRSLAAYLGHTLAADVVSDLVYTSEQRYHGTPSGIDNSVIAYEQAIWFERRVHEVDGVPERVIEPVHIARPFNLIIGDTGVRSATRLPVGEVRRRWQDAPHTYNCLFAKVGALVRQVRETLASGDIAALGPLLNHNQCLLEQIGVSSPELEHLIAAAREAGASGAKLSGGGWGGVMLALTTPATHASVITALQQAGAVRVLQTVVHGISGV